jgi:hypothetical protein
MEYREKRLEVLRQVESGKITLEEGSGLLSQLDKGIFPSPAREDANAGSGVQDAPPAAAAELPEEERQRAERWKQWWILPFVIGLSLSLISMTWMYQGWQAAGAGWGFWLSFIPLALGILLMVVGWQSRNGRWVHVRIHREGRKHPVIAFSLPVPVGSLSFALRMADRFSPASISDADIREAVAAVDREVTPETPLHVWVDGDNGEKVEVWIG